VFLFLSHKNKSPPQKKIVSISLCKHYILNKRKTQAIYREFLPFRHLRNFVLSYRVFEKGRRKETIGRAE
ncbi:MAG: hypothetical protein PUJ49_07395, partial [bacterium]|nr:hypothetical protein [bacterium]